MEKSGSHTGKNQVARETSGIQLSDEVERSQLEIKDKLLAGQKQPAALH